MARVTVEDCLKNVNNRFDLILDASKRARKLSIEGTPALVPEENDKPTVIALREIADNLLSNEQSNSVPVIEDNQETEVS